jgi:hypothetical protein
MTNNVSLLPNQTKFRLDQIRLTQKAKSISFWGLGVLGLVLVIVFMVFFVSQNLLSRSEKKLKTAQADFRSLGEEVEINQETRYRLKLVSEIMTGRFNYGTAIKTALDFLPPETLVSGVEFEGKGVLAVRGCLDNYQLMDAFEKKMEDEASFGEGRVLKAELKNLMVKDNNWCFDLEVGVEI